MAFKKIILNLQINKISLIQKLKIPSQNVIEKNEKCLKNGRLRKFK